MLQIEDVGRRVWRRLRWRFQRGAAPAKEHAAQVEAMTMDQALRVIEQHRPGQVLAPRYLVPSAHKLCDFRQEEGFADIANEAVTDGRTLLDYNRLLTLWQGVRNSRGLTGAAAEVGTYRGGSARFIAAAQAYWQISRPLHVFDTFEGHPDFVDETRDGPHQAGLFGDTSLAAVQAYLADFGNIHLHAGRFEDTSAGVANERFAFVHLDVDLYQSTLHALDFIWPRLQARGVLVIDDYGFTTCAGLKEAVDRFMAQLPPHTFGGWYIHTGQFVIEKYSGEADNQ